MIFEAQTCAVLRCYVNAALTMGMLDGLIES